MTNIHIDPQPPNVLGPTLRLCAVVGVLCATLLGIAACSPGGAAVSVPKDATRVDVTLSSYGIRFDPATPIEHGRIAFVVTNEATIPHELVMFGGVAHAAQMPMKDGDVDEDSTVLHSVLDSGASLAPKETKVFVETIPAGQYVAVCNLAGHFKLGMHIDVTVK